MRFPPRRGSQCAATAASGYVDRLTEVFTPSNSNGSIPKTIFDYTSFDGLGRALASAQTIGSNGVYGWSGIYGTVFWIDPKEKLVAIMMVQRYPGSQVAAAFRPLVYQALLTAH